MITAGMCSNNFKVYLIPALDGDASKNLSFITIHIGNTACCPFCFVYFYVCGSTVIFSIWSLDLKKKKKTYFELSWIHSYIFIRPLEKVLTFKVLPLQVGFYDAEILVSLGPLSRWRIVKFPQCTVSSILSCTFCLLLFTQFKDFSVRNSTLRDIFSLES